MRLMGHRDLEIKHGTTAWQRLMNLYVIGPSRWLRRVLNSESSQVWVFCWVQVEAIARPNQPERLRHLDLFSLTPITTTIRRNGGLETTTWYVVSSNGAIQLEDNRGLNQ
jgi:hypothetical protein